MVTDRHDFTQGELLFVRARRSAFQLELNITERSPKRGGRLSRRTSRARKAAPVVAASPWKMAQPARSPRRTRRRARMASRLRFPRFVNGGISVHDPCHRQTPFPAVGMVRNVMVVGASVTVPAVVAAPSNAGIASAGPSASSFPFSCTRCPSRRSDDKV
jgi:hypothetical protein